MAILEVNLTKPALIEDQGGRAESVDRPEPRGELRSSSDGDDSGGSSSSGGGKARLLGLLALVAAVGMAVRRFRNRGSDTEPVEEYEHGAEPDIGSDERVETDGGVRKTGALAVAVAVAAVAVLARKRRN